MHYILEEAIVNIGYNLFDGELDTSFVDDLHFDETDFDDLVLEIGDLLEAKGIQIDDDSLRETALDWQTLGDTTLFLENVLK